MELVHAKLNGEFEMILPAHRAARPEWYTELGWEKKRLQSMHEKIGPDDGVLYVGAELGEMPALLAMWGADVILVEPNFKSWPVIKETFDANGVKPYACVAAFASNKNQAATKRDNAIFNGTGQYLRPDGWPHYVEAQIEEAHGFNSLHEEANSHDQIRIDDYLPLFPDFNLTALTLDVEGAEWEVLRGAERTLYTKHPKIWLSLHPEFMFDQWGEYSHDLREWIKKIGYKETILDYQHEVHLLYEH